MIRYLFFFLGLVPSLLLAQSKHCVQGRVLDENQAGLPLATIFIKGTQLGTNANLDGYFTLCWVDTLKNVTLSINFTGYERKEIHVRNQSALGNIQLSAGASLQEVVVIDYKVPLIQQDNTTMAYAIQAPTRRLTARKHRSEQAQAYPSQLAIQQEQPSGEGYNRIEENGLQLTKKAPISTLSTDVDRAAYANVRRFLNEGQRPPTDAVRIEEMINYFRYTDPSPTGNDPVAIRSELTDCPWNPAHQLLRIGLRAKGLDETSLAAANFVFLIDVSGSMSGEDRLPLVKKALQALALNLRAEDRVSIVVYAGAAGLVLPPTSGADQATILEALEKLSAGGSTAGGQGIQLAYKVAAENFLPGGNNRVILATDGDFNVGISSQTDLVALIETQRASHIFLTILGVGRGNYQEGTMQMLANKGNGNHAYLDNLAEARKVLIDELGGTLYTVAKDVKLQLTFDAEKVKAYRLVGYENRLLNTEDFDDDAKDAAELGAAHVVTVLYEILPEKNTQDKDTAIGSIRLRYKTPEGEKSQLLSWDLPAYATAFGQASSDLRWAAAVAEFGLLLRDSPHKGKATYTHCQAMAKAAQGGDPFGYRKEMIQLIALAEKLR